MIRLFPLGHNSGQITCGPPERLTRGHVTRPQSGGSKLKSQKNDPGKPGANSVGASVPPWDKGPGGGDPRQCGVDDTGIGKDGGDSPGFLNQAPRKGPKSMKK